MLKALEELEEAIDKILIKLYYKIRPLILPLALAYIIYSMYKTSMSGLYDPLESEILATTVKLLHDLLTPFQNAESITWPDGLIGPFIFYLNAVLLVIFSYLLHYPMYKVVNIPPLIVLPLIFIFTYKFIKIIKSSNEAFLALVLVVIIPVTTHATHNMTPGSIVLFMTLMSLYFAARCTETGDIMHAALSGTCAGIAFLIDLPSIVVITPISYMIITKFKKIDRIDLIYALLIPIILSALPLGLHLTIKLGTNFELPTMPETTGTDYFNGYVFKSSRSYWLISLSKGLYYPIVFTSFIGLLVCVWRQTWDARMIIWYSAGAYLALILLSLTGHMDFYHVYLVIIPSILLAIEFVGEIPTIRKLAKPLILLLIIYPTIWVSLTDQLWAKQNLPIGLENIEAVNYMLMDESIYQRAAMYLLNTSHPVDKVVVSPPMDFYMTANRPIEKYSDDVEIGSDVRYIMLSSIDRYKFNRDKKEDLKLKVKYNLVLENKTMVVVYENLEYKRPNESKYYAYNKMNNTFDLRSAVVKYFDREYNIYQEKH